MSDEPTYIDWLTTIEPEEVCEIASKYGNRYAEITEEQIEELRAGRCCAMWTSMASSSD